MDTLKRLAKIAAEGVRKNERYTWKDQEQSSTLDAMMQALKARLAEWIRHNP